MAKKRIGKLPNRQIGKEPPTIRAVVTWELSDEVDQTLVELARAGITVTKAQFARRGVELAIPFYRDMIAKIGKAG